LVCTAAPYHIQEFIVNEKTTLNLSAQSDRYATEVSNADRILRHLGVLAEEVRNSKGTTKLAYEAAHLFLCYAP